MKTWSQLTHEERVRAWRKEINETIQAICNGIPFPEIQDAIEKASEESEAMQTPWFFHEYLMEYAWFKISKIALLSVKGFLYSEQNEYAVNGICE